jgi:hypothetical protein
MSVEIGKIDAAAMIRFGAEIPVRQDIAKSPQIMPQFACFEPAQGEIFAVTEGGRRYSIDAKIGKEF